VPTVVIGAAVIGDLAAVRRGDGHRGGQRFPACRRPRSEPRAPRRVRDAQQPSKIGAARPATRCAAVRAPEQAAACRLLAWMDGRRRISHRFRYSDEHQRDRGVRRAIRRAVPSTGPAVEQGRRQLQSRNLALAALSEALGLADAIDIYLRAGPKGSGGRSQVRTVVPLGSNSTLGHVSRDMKCDMKCSRLQPSEASKAPPKPMNSGLASRDRSAQGSHNPPRVGSSPTRPTKAKAPPRPGLAGRVPCSSGHICVEWPPVGDHSTV
jgi:hypothetical protein